MSSRRSWVLACALLSGCVVEDVIATCRAPGCLDSGVEPIDAARVDAAVPSYCDGTGPPILVSDRGMVCSGEIATGTFRFAVCTCDAYVGSAQLTTDSFASADGPYRPGGRGGGVGTNGGLDLNAPTSIGGSVWVAGSDGMGGGGGAEVVIGNELWVDGPCELAASLEVARDMRIDGRVQAGELRVGGVLQLPEGADLSVTGAMSVGSVVRGPVTVSTPCACAAADLVDVAGLVRAAQADNDDAAMGVDARVLDGFTGPLRVELPCGRLYLTRLSGMGDLELVITGRTALFVGGDAYLDGSLTVTLAAGAELDLFIEGNLSSNGDLRVGDSTVPARARLYVGGGGTIDLDAGALFAGNLYAPRAELVASGDIEAFGSVFVRRVTASGRFTVHYDTSVLRAADPCPERPTCDGCQDCRNQACIAGECGRCTDSSQCCTPLVCAAGACVAEPI